MIPVTYVHVINHNLLSCTCIGLIDPNFYMHVYMYNVILVNILKLQMVILITPLSLLTGRNCFFAYSDNDFMNSSSALK